MLTSLLHASIAASTFNITQALQVRRSTGTVLHTEQNRTEIRLSVVAEVQ